MHDALMCTYEKQRDLSHRRELKVRLVPDPPRRRCGRQSGPVRGRDACFFLAGRTDVRLRQAFIELPKEPHAALHLAAIEGLTYAAAAVGVSVGTLMSRIARTPDELRAIEDIGSIASTNAAGHVM